MALCQSVSRSSKGAIESTQSIGKLTESFQALPELFVLETRAASSFMFPSWRTIKQSKVNENTK
jgi:hypothetical protein